MSSSSETSVTPVIINLPIDVDVPNSEFPVVLYRRAADANDLEDHFRLQFWAHKWGGMWTDGIFGYHHFHSNAHEVLGVIDGEAELMLGGAEGRELKIGRGDVLILPAGTGHRRLTASPDFRVVGAYPLGQEGYDIYTPSLDFANARGRLRAVPRPGQDPLYGERGALLDLWPDRSDRRHDRAYGVRNLSAQSTLKCERQGLAPKTLSLRLFVSHTRGSLSSRIGEPFA